MSTTATSSSSTSPAPWRPLFLTHLSKMESPEFVLSTLAPAPEGSLIPFLPRARTCVYRSMWAELPPNKHSKAEYNERVYESDMLTFTTDVRMGKVPELFATSPGRRSAEQPQGSGGGGPVECVFWIKKAMTQWRIKGVGYVIASDIEGANEDAESSGVRTVKSTLGERMRVVNEDKKGDWRWIKELNAHFENLNPVMRGSFKNPPPGVPVGIPVEDSDLELGQRVDIGLEDEVARRNFRVVVIRPDIVEQVDLTDPKRARRWRYTFVESEDDSVKSEGKEAKVSGQWLVEELWP